MVRCDVSELLVVYDGAQGNRPSDPIDRADETFTRLDLGCYITRHGTPTRSCRYVRWEAKATSCSHVGAHLLLFSSDFVEIRHIQTGRLVQVIEGEGIRLLSSEQLPGEKVTLIALRDGTGDTPGPQDKIVELVETQELRRSSSVSSSPTFTPRSEYAASDIWDMWE